MTEKCNAGHEVSRREFMVAAGATAAVGGAIGTTATPAAAAVAANEICRMDAVTLADKIRTKQLSPTEVTDAVLARMEKLNPVLGAFCTPSPDIARAQAKAIEADIMAGKSVGLLAGVPVGIKDLVYTKGIKTTSGSIIYKDFVPTEDDVVVVPGVADRPALPHNVQAGRGPRPRCAARLATTAKATSET